MATSIEPGIKAELGAFGRETLAINPKRNRMIEGRWPHRRHSGYSLFRHSQVDVSKVARAGVSCPSTPRRLLLVTILGRVKNLRTGNVVPRFCNDLRPPWYNDIVKSFPGPDRDASRDVHSSNCIEPKGTHQRLLVSKSRTDLGRILLVTHDYNMALMFPSLRCLLMFGRRLALLSGAKTPRKAVWISRGLCRHIQS